MIAIRSLRLGIPVRGSALAGYGLGLREVGCRRPFTACANAPDLHGPPIRPLYSRVGWAVRTGGHPSRGRSVIKVPRWRVLSETSQHEQLVV